MTTIVEPCKCKHAYQDAVYGPGMRVKNVAHKGSRKGEANCTVCGPSSRKKKHCGFRHTKN